ncbi:AraC family transcriptional regulator ligand-binding domain-containing protein [Phenylobacterium sp.]|uniref:AraC family transcriptional regulator n=1 Tax=Phenylobacterium sp. TaxID=1871053 RepID=UPI00289A646E|nr:AraC family transcriptional regulator ligand-binding domain-containing protein [Phenylobacterium sp.]
MYRAGVIHSGFLEGAAPLIRELGSDPEGLAVTCGLPPEALTDGSLVLPGPAVFDFLERAAEACAAPDFALQMAARRGGLHMLGPVWVVMRTASTVGEALAAGASNLAFRMTAISAQISQEVDAWAVELDSAAARERDVQGMEFCLALVTLQMRAWLGSGWRPLTTQFRHSAPQDRHAHTAIFGHTIQFEQDRNAIVFDPAAWSTPLPSDDRRASRVLSEALQWEAILEGENLPRRVTQALRAGLPRGRIGLADVALDLGMPCRTLQDRLRRSGATFHDLLDAVRIELAVRYLCSSALPAYRIAELLSFADSSAFSRFVKHRTGRSPRDVRRDGGARLLAASNRPPAEARASTRHVSSDRGTFPGSL